MVGLPSPRDDVHRSLRVPDIREGTFSPLANAPLPACPEDCNSPGLATQRLPRSGLSDMSQTRLPPCGDASSSASHNDCRAAPAVQRQHETKRGAANRDAVQLTQPTRLQRYQRHGALRGRAKRQTPSYSRRVRLSAAPAAPRADKKHWTEDAE